MSWIGDRLQGAWNNTKALASGTANAVTNPVQTLSGVGDAIVGAASATWGGVEAVGGWVGNQAASGYNFIAEDPTRLYRGPRDFINYTMVEPYTNIPGNIREHGLRGAGIEFLADHAERSALIAQGVVRGGGSILAMVGGLAKVTVNNVIIAPIRWPLHAAAAFVDSEEHPMEWRPGDIWTGNINHAIMGHDDPETGLHINGWVDHTRLEDFVTWNNERTGRGDELTGHQRALMYGTQGVAEIGAFVLVGGGVGLLARGGYTAGRLGGHAVLQANRSAQITRLAGMSDDAGNIATRLQNIRGAYVGAELNMSAANLSVTRSAAEGWRFGAEAMSPFHWNGLLNKAGATADVISVPILALQENGEFALASQNRADAAAADEGESGLESEGAISPAADNVAPTPTRLNMAGDFDDVAPAPKTPETQPASVLQANFSGASAGVTASANGAHAKQQPAQNSLPEANNIEIQDGDTLSLIVQSHYDDPQNPMNMQEILDLCRDIAEINDIADIDRIYAGNDLTLPARGDIQRYLEQSRTPQAPAVERSPTEILTA